MQPTLFDWQPETLQERLTDALRQMVSQMPQPPEFVQTIKTVKTPGGRTLMRMTARGHRTSASGSSGWPTAKGTDGSKGGGLSKNEQDLVTTAELASWPTPTVANAAGVRDATSGRVKVPPSGKCGFLTLVDAADMAGWPTPMAGSPGTEDYNPAGNTDSSRRTVELVAGWATPSAQVFGDTPETHLARKVAARAAGKSMGLVVSTLFAQAHLATTGPTPPSSPAATASTGASRGALNPAFSLWLQGYPPAWLAAGLRAATTTRSRRAKSKAASAC